MRKEGMASKPSHVTTGNVFDDLGLDAGEALEAKVKSDIWRAIINRIEQVGYTQADLVGRLKVHQPDVSNLLNGKISRFSVTKLIQLAAQAGLARRGEDDERRNRTAQGDFSGAGKARSPWGGGRNQGLSARNRSNSTPPRSD